LSRLEKLTAAVDRGAVKKITQNGIDYFMFPNLKIGTLESVSQSVQGERTKEITGIAFEALGTLVDDTTWDINGTDTNMQKNFLEDMVQNITVERSTLSEEVVKLDKTIKTCEKAAEILERIIDKSIAVQDASVYISI
jgi:hypothetical protein